MKQLRDIVWVLSIEKWEFVKGKDKFAVSQYPTGTVVRVKESWKRGPLRPTTTLMVQKTGRGWHSLRNCKINPNNIDKKKKIVYLGNWNGCKNHARSYLKAVKND